MSSSLLVLLVVCIVIAYRRENQKSPGESDEEELFRLCRDV